MQMEDLFDLFHVRRQIEMREDDALWVRRSSHWRRSRWRCRRAWRVSRRPETTRAFALETALPTETPPAFPQARGFSRQIFRVNDLAGRLHRNFFQKCFRGDHCFQLALLRAGCQRFVRRRVVQIDGNFAKQQRGPIHQRSGNGRWQQNADHFLIAPQWAQAARQKDGLDQRLAKGEFRSASIGHREVARVATGGFDETSA